MSTIKSKRVKSFSILYDNLLGLILELTFKPFIFMMSILTVIPWIAYFLIAPLLFMIILHYDYTMETGNLDSSLGYTVTLMTIGLLFIWTLLYNATRWNITSMEMLRLRLFFSGEYTYPRYYFLSLAFDALKIVFTHPIAALRIVLKGNGAYDKKLRRTNYLKLFMGFLIMTVLSISSFWLPIQSESTSFILKIETLFIFLNMSMMLAALFATIKTFNVIFGNILELLNIVVLLFCNYVAFAWKKVDILLPSFNSDGYVDIVGSLSFWPAVFAFIIKFIGFTLIAVSDTLVNINIGSKQAKGQ